MLFDTLWLFILVVCWILCFGGMVCVLIVVLVFELVSVFGLFLVWDLGTTGFVFRLQF